MEKILKKVPYVQYETKEVFKTKDGKEFMDEEFARAHEQCLIDKDSFDQRYKRSRTTIDYKHYDVITIDSINKKSKDEVVMQFPYLSRNHIIKPGIHIIHTDESSDYVSQSIEHVDDLISEYELTISQLKELKNTYGKKAELDIATT